MSTYIARFIDGKMAMFEVIFHASNDANGIAIANAINDQSNLDLFEVIKTETILLNSVAPLPASDGNKKGVCFYYYQNGAIKDLIKFAVPDPKFLSSGSPITEVEPFSPSLVGLVQTEEGNNSTTFSRAKFDYRSFNP